MENTVRLSRNNYGEHCLAEPIKYRVYGPAAREYYGEYGLTKHK